jgi:hypothetical protein
MASRACRAARYAAHCRGVQTRQQHRETHPLSPSEEQAPQSGRYGRAFAPGPSSPGGTINGKSSDISTVMFCSGGPERTRTSDLRFRKPLLYPAELRDQLKNFASAYFLDTHFCSLNIPSHSIFCMTLYQASSELMRDSPVSASHLAAARQVSWIAARSAQQPLSNKPTLADLSYRFGFCSGWIGGAASSKPLRLL